MSQWLDYKKSKKQEETKTTRTIDREKQLSPSKMSSTTKTPIEIKLMKLAGADLTKPTVPQWKPVEGPVVIKQEDMEITSTVSTTEADKSERTDSSPIHLMGKPASRPSYHVSEDFSEDTICGIPFPVTVGYESQVPQAEGSPNAYRQHYTSNRDHFRRYFTANPYPVPQMITKRKHEPAQEVTPKRQKVDRASKTPSAVLNELYPGLAFEYSNQLGPAHDPKFEVYVSLPLNNKKYQGSGRSKKLAKQNVAETILLDVGSAVASQCKIDVDVPREAVHDIPMPDEIRQESHHEALRAPSQVMAPFQHEMQMQQSPEFDFTSDDLADLAVSGYPHALQATMLPVPSAAAAPFVSQNILKRLMKTDVIDQPICALQGILGAGDDISYEFLPVDTTVPQHQRIYRVKLTSTLRSFVTAKQMGFQEQVFIGEAKSKKQAKADAARLALISIIGPEYFDFLANLDRSTVVNKKKGNAANRPMKPVVAQAQSPAQETEIDPEAEDYSLAFSQKVKTLITEKHAELMQGDPTYSPNKVLAGIVMTLGSPLIDNMHVIAVTTGTKCINGDFMSDKGVALNDCHAEILATRCLRDFLYSQIDALVTTLDSGDDKKQGIIDGVIFEKQEKTVDGVLRFQLKPNVKFHLYISTSPCGDARIFSPKGLEVSYDENSSESSPSVPPGEDIESDSHPNRINRGLLRAKIEAGEGTIPVANLIDSGVLQTWDGIMLGNALRTMSCSDKICRWNVIGAQGALLSLFIDPIYYSSIILGSLHHPIHFKRAVYSRIESIPPLSPPYRLNKPRLLMVANKGKRRVAKSPNHSVIWTCSWNSHEVVSSAKGRCEPAGVTSRLCKRLAFMRFLKYYKNDTGRLDNYAQISYDAAKNLATAYQASKQQLIDYMDEIGYGGWIAKPLEQDTFFI